MITPQLDRVRRIPAFLSACAAVCMLVLAGCGSGTDSDAAPPPSQPAPSSSTASAGGSTNSPEPTSPATPTPAVDKEVTVVVAKRKVTPPTGRVEVPRGALVRITVTSDVKDSVHVHGYDRTVELTAGVPGSLDLRADRSGLFEVETHDTDLVLFQLVVR